MGKIEVTERIALGENYGDIGWIRTIALNALTIEHLCIALTQG